jgi:pyrroloquinoline quinone (PQQ) biosynthesis protein C
MNCLFGVVIVSYKQKLLDQYLSFPFHKHPLWTAVLEKRLSYREIIQAEIQHYLRSKRGRELRAKALELSRNAPRIYERLLETYFEECTEDKSGPSHLALIERLVINGGATVEDLSAAIMTPGNIAAVALYEDITARGPGCHMLGAGVVEHFYSQLCPRIYEVYIGHYGMTSDQAETYRIHGPMDAVHADRAFDILDDAISLHGWTTVELSVRDAFVATSLHYDGMLQAATGITSYWDGR